MVIGTSKQKNCKNCLDGKVGRKMSEEALYAIIYSVIAIFVIYTIVIIIGFIQAYRIDKRNFDYFLEIKKIVEEIKQVIIKEEFVTMGKEIKNTLTLSDLVSNKASEEQ